MADEQKPKRIRRHRDWEVEAPAELVIIVVLAVCGTIVGVVYLLASGGGCG